MRANKFYAQAQSTTHANLQARNKQKQQQTAAGENPEY